MTANRPWTVVTFCVVLVAGSVLLPAQQLPSEPPRQFGTSITGAFVGGIAIGVVEALVTAHTTVQGADYTAVFVVLQDYLSSITINWMSFIGLMFILVVLFFPRGLLGFIRSSPQPSPASGSRSGS